MQAIENLWKTAVASLDALLQFKRREWDAGKKKEGEDGLYYYFKSRNPLAKGEKLAILILKKPDQFAIKLSITGKRTVSTPHAMYAYKIDGKFQRPENIKELMTIIRAAGEHLDGIESWGFKNESNIDIKKINENLKILRIALDS